MFFFLSLSTCNSRRRCLPLSSRNKWDDWDVQSWNDMTQQTPAIMCSDNPKFTGGVQVTPIGQLPAWMTYNAAAPPVFAPPPPPQMYAPGAK
jgi:hypothetical protein